MSQHYQRPNVTSTNLFTDLYRVIDHCSSLFSNWLYQKQEALANWWSNWHPFSKVEDDGLPLLIKIPEEDTAASMLDEVEVVESNLDLGNLSASKASLLSRIAKQEPVFSTSYHDDDQSDGSIEFQSYINDEAASSINSDDEGDLVDNADAESLQFMPGQPSYLDIQTFAKLDTVSVTDEDDEYEDDSTEEMEWDDEFKSDSGTNSRKASRANSVDSAFEDDSDLCNIDPYNKGLADVQDFSSREYATLLAVKIRQFSTFTNSCAMEASGETRPIKDLDETPC